MDVLNTRWVARTDYSEAGGIVAARSVDGPDRISPGAALRPRVFALGLACLKARNDVASPAGLAVSLGITAYNLLAAVVLLWTAAASSFGGLLLWGAGIAHAALGALFVSVLVVPRR
jgi:hypothetical protein